MASGESGWFHPVFAAILETINGEVCNDIILFVIFVIMNNEVVIPTRTTIYVGLLPKYSQVHQSFTKPY